MESLFVVVVFVHRSPADNQIDSWGTIELVFRQEGKALPNGEKGWVVTLFGIDGLERNVVVFIVVCAISLLLLLLLLPLL